MHRSNLFWRVLANFGFLLIVLSAMTILTLLILSEIEKNFTIAASGTRTMMKVEAINKALTDIIFDVDLYLTTGSSSSRTAYVRDAAGFENLLREASQNATDTTFAQLFSDASKLFGSWRDSYADKKVIIADQKYAGLSIDNELRSLETVEIKNQYLMKLRANLGDVSRRLSTSQLHSLEIATSLGNKLGQFIGFVNILLAIFALLLGFYLTRYITSPVRLLKEGTQNIMKGEFRPITLERSDELGQLAADFNHMSKMLGANYTRLQAYSELVTALNAQADMAEVESRSLTLLCHHVHAAVGAIYILDDTGTKLHLAAGYALKNGSNQKRTYLMGEGIPGQCLAEQKTIEMLDIPRDAGFNIDTGLVEVPPVYTLAVPIMFQDRMLGVIVLGAMSNLEELHKEIIQNSVPQIGVAIANARNYEATQKLSIEIARKNDQLNQKNAELEKAYRVKSDFLASMSHELRTPLNSIIGFSSVLIAPNSEPLTSDQSKAIEKVLKNGKHLLQLINDILDLSKIESGRMTVTVDTESVENVVGNSLMTIEALVRAKNISLKQSIATDLPAMNTDSLKVKQILVNLLSNASKFTESGEITVTASFANDLLVFAVKDTGIGIDRKNLERVFEEFQQIDSSTTRKYKGTGLGLPISRRLARMLGGDLTLESEVGKGSTFTLLIPPVYKSEDEEKPKTPPQSQPQPQPQPQAQPQPIEKEESVPVVLAPPAPGTTVLCIDDDQDVIDILRGYLVPAGYTMLQALSGDEGIAAAAQAHPDLITLDIMMPNKDGWQVLRELKQNQATRDIPVLIHSIIDNKPLALSLGAVDVIPKPTDPKRMMTMVKLYCKTKEQYVLIIDKNLLYTASARRMLENEGIVTRVASTGGDALTIIEKLTPAIILLDPQIIESDGYPLVQKLQANETWRNIPVIILSGKPMTEKDMDRWHIQIKQYLTKEESTPETIASIVKRTLCKS